MSTVYVYDNNRSLSVVFDQQDNNPWFKAKDVTEILCYNNTDKAVKDHVREKYRRCALELGVNGDESSFTVYISEQGLYALILKSKSSIAEKFQDWILEDVLPSVRKYAEYRVKQLNAELIQSLNRALEINRNLYELKSRLEVEIRDQAPKLTVLPRDKELTHVFCVLTKNNNNGNECGVTEYKCIRTEKRSFKTALKKAENEGFEISFKRENVPNGINVLNKAKEVMSDYDMHYQSHYNNIITPYNFVNIVQHVLNREEEAMKLF